MFNLGLGNWSNLSKKKKHLIAIFSVYVGTVHFGGYDKNIQEICVAFESYGGMIIYY